jgi:hypothetical protein
VQDVAWIRTLKPVRSFEGASSELEIRAFGSCTVHCIEHSPKYALWLRSLQFGFEIDCLEDYSAESAAEKRNLSRQLFNPNLLVFE